MLEDGVEPIEQVNGLRRRGGQRDAGGGNLGCGQFLGFEHQRLM